MTESVLYEVGDGIATLTLNRPDRLNAMDGPMRAQLAERLVEADTDHTVRVIVVTGAGRGFCAGADTKELTSVSGEVIRASEGRSSRVSLSRWMEVTKPTIAAVNGPCVGLGFCLALVADLRFVSEEAKFSSAFSRLGLPAESGSAWLLSRLVGPARALDLLYSSRLVTGREALEIGLAQRCSPGDELIDDVRAYARLLVEMSPHSQRVMRDQVYADGGRSFGSAFDDSVAHTAACVDRAEFQSRLAGRPVAR